MGYEQGQKCLFCNRLKITSAIILALLEASASCILPAKGMPFCPMQPLVIKFSL